MSHHTISILGGVRQHTETMVYHLPILQEEPRPRCAFIFASTAARRTRHVAYNITYLKTVGGYRRRHATAVHCLRVPDAPLSGWRRATVLHHNRFTAWRRVGNAQYWFSLSPVTGVQCHVRASRPACILSGLCHIHGGACVCAWCVVCVNESIALHPPRRPVPPSRSNSPARFAAMFARWLRTPSSLIE